MTRSIRSLAMGGALIAGVAVALAGCVSTAPNTDFPTGEAGVQIEVDAAWLDDGRVIGLVTTGSSSCVPNVTDAAYVDGVLEVSLEDPSVSGDAACTRDFVSRTTFVSTPAGIDPAQDLPIAVTGEGFTGAQTLAGAEGLAGPGGETTGEPSAGWTQTNNTFLILTWGSSSCAPIVESSAVTGPTEITVTFEQFAADQVCTLDFAPRATLAFGGGAAGDDVEAVLVGAEFDGVRVPIVGSN